MSHPNEELVHKFYRAFAERDAATMGTCYADDVRFTDPAFEGLVGDEARGMWRMLCEQGTDLRIEHSGVQADDREGVAHWEAWYSFGPNKRKVHNIIDARFTFRDGLIVEHVDTFDFHRWSRMALGVPGLLLGWTPMLRNTVRKTAGRQLQKYLARNS